MAEVKWVKLTVDMFDDEKIKIIQAMPEGDALLVVWIKLVTLAGKTNDGGYIYISEGLPYTEEMLSVIMNKPISTIRLALDVFSRLGMTDNDTKGIFLINFEKHQSLDKLEKIKIQNRERKRLQRERQKMLPICDNTVTSHADVTECHAIDIEEDKDKEKDIKKFIKPTLEEVQAYCNQRNKGVDAQKWFDYYTSNGWKVGKNPMKDWKAAIRTWERSGEGARDIGKYKRSFDYDKLTE